MALDAFRKADKQDGGHCVPCKRNIVRCGIELRDWKAAESAAREMVADAHDETAVAIAHYTLGMVLMNEAISRHKEDLYSDVHQGMAEALKVHANFPDAVYADGRALAYMNRDADAKARFEELVKMRPEGNPDRQRAMRFIAQLELAKAKLAPAFATTDSNGKRVSLDDFAGKVVLLDFWATWCEPCRAAMPHIREIAKKFQHEPLVILSVSLDEDEKDWREFITKQEMTWLQCRDGDGFRGDIARIFEVIAIPHTFTIDADGILQDEHIGDASVEGKLKKLLARAKELQQIQQSQKTPQ